MRLLRSLAGLVAVARQGRFLALTTVSSVLLTGCGESAPTVQLLTNFEGASLGSHVRTGDWAFDLTIGHDSNSDFLRWYSFRIATAELAPFTFHIINAGQTSAAAAWPFNQPVVSQDGGATWQRIADVGYDGQVFTFRYTPVSASGWIAYSPVYNYSRWTGLVAEINDHPRVRSVAVIANSLAGNPIHLVEVTDPTVPALDKSAIWVTARQHPAEAGGSWMAEGMLDWILSEQPAARELLRSAVVYLVPFMNPDGVLLGNYRVNRVGVNLNRVWNDADPSYAPSVAAVVREMESFVADGGNIAIFVDFHTHSSERKNFLIYNGADITSPQMGAEIEAFTAVLNRINPDFTAAGSEQGGIDTRLARAWAYQALGIHAVTCEGSYQDVDHGPGAGHYMTVDRYLDLGAAFGKAVAEFFFGISEGDGLALHRWAAITEG
jgi:hypothetical protein